MGYNYSSLAWKAFIPAPVANIAPILFEQRNNQKALLCYQICSCIRLKHQDRIFKKTLCATCQWFIRPAQGYYFTSSPTIVHKLYFHNIKSLLILHHSTVIFTTKIFISIDLNQSTPDDLLAFSILISAIFGPLEIKTSTTYYKLLQSWDTIKSAYPNRSTLSMTFSTSMFSTIWCLQMKTSTIYDNFLKIWKTIKSITRPKYGRYWFISAFSSFRVCWYFGLLSLWAMLEKQDEI